VPVKVPETELDILAITEESMPEKKLLTPVIVLARDFTVIVGAALPAEETVKLTFFDNTLSGKFIVYETDPIDVLVTDPENLKGNIATEAPSTVRDTSLFKKFLV